ncbi:MAG: prolipoprotein diacylglyceryl transferase [Caedibacter sp. 38-128]|nr:prolipoprotein diacylglyceryl transferase [Holosporales bacterium]OJX03582.1 MAG: prolipoprotein diacylglyceryl transferase [Caedibacter sp. 38-128]
MLITYPEINPIALQLGPLAIHWYGLAYVAGILLGWRYAIWLIRKQPLKITPQNLTDFISFATIGIVLGGRLGHALFYAPGYYLYKPWEILFLWQPGMAFHGGLLGFLGASLWFCRRRHISFLELMDLAACAAPIGIFFGRIANFINGELWGRATGSDWGMIFPHADALPRHPSQLYEAASEGLLLFLALFLAARFSPWRQKYQGLLSGFFLIGYAIARIVIECFREPDQHIGYLLWGTTLGQWLTLPLLFAGLGLVLFARQKAHAYDAV